MIDERLREMIAVIVIGDGVVGLTQPRRHTWLWRSGPRPYQEAMQAFIERPGMTQVVSLVQISLGLWLWPPASDTEFARTRTMKVARWTLPAIVAGHRARRSGRAD